MSDEEKEFVASFVDDGERVGARRPGTGDAAPRPCLWCGRDLSALGSRFVYCGQKCRQSAFRLRRRREGRAVGARPALDLRPERRAYADPPYLWHCGLYGHFHPEGWGCWDEASTHQQLVDVLEKRRGSGEIAGWGISCSSASLRTLLPMCPPETRVCDWIKPGGVNPSAAGVHVKKEHVLVVGGRPLRPAVRDWLMAHPARGGGSLPGRKPIAFCSWLFDLLGMVPGDTLDDMFPGTGVVGRAWKILGERNAPVVSGDRVLFSTNRVGDDVHSDAEPPSEYLDEAASSGCLDDEELL